jgi:hypothetical protein
MKLYEQLNIPIDEKLIAQYLQNRKIAKEFAVYYDLFNKYKSDYQVATILSGEASETIKTRAKNAKFDERLALMGLVLDAILDELRAVCLREQTSTELLNILKDIKIELNSGKQPAIELMDKHISALKKRIEKGKLSSTMSAEAQYTCHSALSILETMRQELVEKQPKDGNAAFTLLKFGFDNQIKAMKEQADNAKQQLSNVFHFCEEVFDEGQEMLILVTELTISSYGAHFISRYGCPEYFAHNKELLFYERQREIIKEIEELSLD